ncbi:cytochrome P450 [Rhizophagus irregularis]|uniref:Cytochrome P450 n=1 Tax=Rhizophagus irregularis TaxID=588596 RepID=A0A2I1GRH7_9GLOM|nr:cytochrome P450 [Rhizophagus irregularis]
MYQPIILGSILFVTLYILKRMRSPKLNMPPLVRYKYPIIGHTYDFLTNSEEFFKQCRKEYGDIFSLYVWGEVRTFIGKEHFQEVLSRDDSFVFGKQVDLDSIFKHNIKFTNRPKVLKDYVLNKLKLYTERMQESLNIATQKYIGDCDEPNVIHNIYPMITNIISNPLANIFIGEEESQYEEVIVTFSELTIDTTKLLRIPPILNFIYPGLQAFINNSILSLGIYNPAINHQKVLIKHLKNQFCKRLQEKVKYGDSWKRPDDFIQNIMEEESFDPNNINYEEIADKLCLLIVVLVHTTANSCTHAIMNLASRPEYMQELYEEQLEVQKEADENGILPFEALNNMKKLDSFIKESFRLSESVATLPHVTTKDYTFSNGLQVPKDHSIYLYVDDIYLDESLQGPNPQSFEPFRHLNTNASASKVSKNYVVFGGGKHACPGRQLAVNEIKFFLHNIILKYNLRTESGKIEGPKMIGTIKLPSNAGIIFEKRK